MDLNETQGYEAARGRMNVERLLQDLNGIADDHDDNPPPLQVPFGAICKVTIFHNQDAPIPLGDVHLFLCEESSQVWAEDDHEMLCQFNSVHYFDFLRNEGSSRVVFSFNRSPAFNRKTRTSFVCDFPSQENAEAFSYVLHEFLESINST